MRHAFVIDQLLGARSTQERVQLVKDAVLLLPKEPVRSQHHWTLEGDTLSEDGNQRFDPASECIARQDE